MHSECNFFPILVSLNLYSHLPQAPGGPRPGVRMGSTPMSSGGPTNVASTMFMEFSPNAVTINSVSAHVLPAEVSASFAANAGKDY